MLLWQQSAQITESCEPLVYSVDVLLHPVALKTECPSSNDDLCPFAHESFAPRMGVRVSGLKNSGAGGRFGKHGACPGRSVDVELKKISRSVWLVSMFSFIKEPLQYLGQLQCSPALEIEKPKSFEGLC